MMKKRLVVLVALFVGTLASSFLFAPDAATQEIHWKKIERGLLYARLEVEDGLIAGKSRIHVYNIDPSRYALRLQRDVGDGEGLTFDAWYRKTDAPVLVNIGTGTAVGPPKGIVRLSGETVRNRLLDGWKGLLVMAPEIGSSPSSRILDLQVSPFDPERPGFLDILQQPMVLDEKGELRVEPRLRRATRIALAEDGSRNLLVFLTEDPCTLWEMAHWLKSCPFTIKRAIGLGGGDAPQVLGRYAPERIFIEGGADPVGSRLTRNALIDALSTELRLTHVLAVAPMP